MTANAEIELGGPEPVTPLEVVRIFEEELGEPIAVGHAPEEAFQQQAESAPTRSSAPSAR